MPLDSTILQRLEPLPGNERETTSAILNKQVYAAITE
jgi:hypothetical protein